MIELLTGPMLGVEAGRSGSLSKRGLVAIAIDPCAFGRTLEEVSSGVESVINDLDGAAFPGLQSGSRLDEARRTGMIDVESATLERLKALCIKTGA